MQSNLNLRFSRQDPANFFKTIRSRVNDYVKENKVGQRDDVRMYIKAFAMLAIYFVPFGIMLSQALPAWTGILLYGVMGVGISGIGLAIMHDANHGSYSKHNWLNNLLSYTMNLIGGSSFTWKVQHNLLHHTYTNIYEIDEDIHDKPFLRLSPFGKYKKHHRYQHIYAMALYGLATLSWVGIKDFRQLVQYRDKGLIKRMGSSFGKELAILSISKLLYFGYIIALPLALGIPWWVVVAGFVLMHMVAGIIITTIFQLAHVVEGPDHFVPEPSGQMDNSWAIHQLSTTANFSRKNKFITWFVGGLNFQVEHHLFPNISHIHYPKLSKIVESTAKEYNLPYYDNPQFFKAVASHLRVLKEFGKGEQVKQKPQSKIAA